IQVMLTVRFAVCSLLFFVASQSWAADAGSPQTLRYTISMNGRIAGSETDTYYPDGRVDSAYEYNDRGRGPKVSAHYVLSADGSPLRMDAAGNDYYKAPVDEHFALEPGKAHWKSTSEDGQSQTPGFYISNNGASAELAFLVAALLDAKGAAVKLL